MPIGGLPNYPTIQQVTAPLRSLVGDDMAGATGTLGEGQIFVDNTALSVTNSNFFNLALQMLCQLLRTNSGPMLIYDNFLFINVPPLESPTMGLGAPDPSVQVSFGFNGYFNGTSMNPAFALPQACIMVERVWERMTGTNDQFFPLQRAKQGIPSAYQSTYNGIWEPRQDQVWMPGSITNMDYRLRFQGGISPIYGNGINTATTYIPILDCANALCGLMIEEMAIRQGPLIPQTALAWAKEQKDSFLNEGVKNDQGMAYNVISFGDDQGTTAVV